MVYRIEPATNVNCCSNNVSRRLYVEVTMQLEAH